MPNAKNESNVDEDRIQQFTAVTGTDEGTARHFLEACDGDLNAAIGMQMDSGNGAIPGPSSALPPPATNGTPKRKKAQLPTDLNGPAAVENDSDLIRAPLPQRTEILAPDRIVYRRQGKRRKAHSVFDQFRDFQAEIMRPQEVAQSSAPGGSTRRTLQELFRPPIELLHRGSFQSARQAASSANRWLIATIHNVTEFQCQVLNRDVWSNRAIQEIVRKRFILWQAYSDSEDGRRYMVLYNVTEWPYVAIIDPRTGEKMISWQKIEANTFCEIASEFLELHPAPSDSHHDLRPMKRAKKEPSIVDASEDSQLTAAIAASLQENSYQSANSVVVHTSDDELECLYSSCSDLETFSDSDASRPTSRAASRSGHAASQNQPQLFSIDDTLVTMPQAGGSRTDAAADDGGAAASTSNGNAVEEIGEEEQWKNFLGSDDDPVMTIIFRGPNNFKSQLSLPNSSTLKALVSYVSSHGYQQDQYELVMSFPKRKISQLDLSSTLRDSGFNARETLHIQEI